MRLWVCYLSDCVEMGSREYWSFVDMLYFDDNYRYMNDVVGGGGMMINVGYVV